MKISLSILLYFFFFGSSNGQEAYKETGTASFYSNKFNGRLTASGEPYNCKQYTAAHRTLPVNTQVKITNLKNNKHVIVRINDRGPHSPKRILDLSEAAAIDLGIIEQGLCTVELEVIQFPPNFKHRKPFDADSLLNYHLNDTIPGLSESSF